MTFKDINQQRKACKLAMRKYRENKKAGLVKSKEDPVPYMSREEIEERVRGLQKSIDETYAKRRNEKYDSEEYRNYTSYVSKLKQRIEIWRYHLTMKGATEYFSVEYAINKLNTLNEKLERYNTQLSSGSYKKEGASKKSIEDSLSRLNARIKNIEEDIGRWNKLLTVLRERKQGKVSVHA